MKKVFLSMVGLAFASCTTPDEGKTGGAGGAGEFEFEVTNIGEQSAFVKITAKEEGRTFYSNCYPKAVFTSVGTTKQLMELLYQYRTEDVSTGEATWAILLAIGYGEYTLNDLTSTTTHCVLAFGIDMDGTLTSSDLSYYEFKTKPSTFDTTRWLGKWDVTSQEMCVQFLSSDNQFSQSYATPESGSFTRTVEIVDAAEDDPKMKGYCYIFGWDGYFPGLPSEGAESYVPVIGMYVDNTIEFVNDFVLDSDPETGLLTEWLACCCEHEYMSEQKNINEYLAFLMGEYAPYTFVMNDAGNVDIKGEEGLGIEGSETLYDVRHFQLVYVDEKSNDLSPVFSKVDEEAIHFAGNTMTAVKAVAEDNGDAGVAPAKLSVKKNNSKKNFRIMHKYANAKSAAFHFSSAIKFSKVRK